MSEYAGTRYGWWELPSSNTKMVISLYSSRLTQAGVGYASHHSQNLRIVNYLVPVCRRGHPLPTAFLSADFELFTLLLVWKTCFSSHVENSSPRPKYGWSSPTWGEKTTNSPPPKNCISVPYHPLLLCNHLLFLFVYLQPMSLGLEFLITANQLTLKEKWEHSHLPSKSGGC